MASTQLMCRQYFEVPSRVPRVLIIAYMCVVAEFCYHLAVSMSAWLHGTVSESASGQVLIGTWLGQLLRVTGILISIAVIPFMWKARSVPLFLWLCGSTALTTVVLVFLVGVVYPTDEELSTGLVFTKSYIRHHFLLAQDMLAPVGQLGVMLVYVWRLHGRAGERGSRCQTRAGEAAAVGAVLLSVAVGSLLAARAFDTETVTALSRAVNASGTHLTAMAFAGEYLSTILFGVCGLLWLRRYWCPSAGDLACSFWALLAMLALSITSFIVGWYAAPWLYGAPGTSVIEAAAGGLWCWVPIVVLVVYIHGIRRGRWAISGPVTLCCGACGYDLRGNVSGRCPECGTLYKGVRVQQTRPTT